MSNTKNPCWFFILASLLDRGMECVNWLPLRTIVCFINLYFGAVQLSIVSQTELLERLWINLCVILFGNRPVRISQCCTQFKPLGNKTFCFRNFHIMMQVQYTNRSICFRGLIYCDRTWLLFLDVQIRLLTRCKICFTLGLSNYFSLKSLSRCLKSHMNVPWSVDYKYIVWLKLWIY